MANYKVNTSSKTVVADIKHLTESEMHIVQMYVAAGYLIKEKKQGLRYSDMRKGLKNDEAALKELESKIKAKENYMKIKKWYTEKTKK